MFTRRFFVRYHTIMLVVLTAMNFIGMLILLIVFLSIKAEDLDKQQSPNSMSQFPPIPPAYMMDSTTSQLLKSQTPVNIHIYSINAYGMPGPENEKFGAASKPMNHVLMFENVYCCPSSNLVKSISDKMPDMSGISPEPIFPSNTTSDKQSIGISQEGDVETTTLQMEEIAQTNLSPQASNSKLLDSYTKISSTESMEQNLKTSSSDQYESNTKTSASSYDSIPSVTRPQPKPLKNSYSTERPSSTDSETNFDGNISVENTKSLTQQENFYLNQERAKPSFPPALRPPEYSQLEQRFLSGRQKSKQSLKPMPKTNEYEDVTTKNQATQHIGPPSSPDLDFSGYTNPLAIVESSKIGSSNATKPRKLSMAKSNFQPLPNPPEYFESSPLMLSDLTLSIPTPVDLANSYKTLGKKLVSRSTIGQSENEKNTMLDLLEDEINRSTESMGNPIESHVLIDCKTASNSENEHNCESWKKAGYCDSHPATRYIFCRKMCLCEDK